MKNVEMGDLPLAKPLKMGGFPKSKAYEAEVKKTADSRLSKFIKEIIGVNYVLDAQDIIYYDAYTEEGLRMLAKNDKSNVKRKEELERTQNSTLKQSGYKNRLTGNGVYQISGIIDGKKIKISNPIDSNIFKGTVDGQDISAEEAEQIWKKYEDIAIKRDYDLDEMAVIHPGNYMANALLAERKAEELKEKGLEPKKK